MLGSVAGVVLTQMSRDRIIFKIAVKAIFAACVTNYACQVALVGQLVTARLLSCRCI